MALPKTKREARQWVRSHWAAMINYADMGGVADLGSDLIEEIWEDECAKIAGRLRGSKPE